VVDVRDPIHKPHDPALERDRLPRPRVVKDPVANLLRQVQALAVALEPLDDPQRVLVVAKAGAVTLAHARVENALADVAERRVAEVVAERDGLGQVLVEAQRPRNGPRDHAGLERVRQPGPVVVALGRDEDLRLVLEPPEGLRVDDPVAVALEGRPDGRILLGRPADRGVGRGRAISKRMAQTGG
jgi:hypothetical protein